MGVVSRQGIKSAAAGYMGMAIGMFNIVWLYPRFLSVQEFGLVRVLIDSAMLLALLGQAGAPMATQRFWPAFRNRPRYAGFLSLLLVWVLAGLALLAVAWVLGGGTVYRAAYAEKSPLLSANAAFVLVLTALIVLQNLLDALCRVHFRQAVPTFWREFILRVLNSVAVLIYAQGGLSLKGFLWVTFSGYALVMLILGAYILRQGWWRLGPIRAVPTVLPFRQVLGYGLMGLLGGMGVWIAYRIDTLMIGAQLGLESAAAYGIVLMMAQVMDVPFKALAGSASADVNLCLHERNYARLRELNRKAARNLLLASTLLYVLLVTNAPDFYYLIPNAASYRIGLLALPFLMLAKLIDNASGLTNDILVYSHRVRLYLLSMLGLAALNVLLNLLLIPVLGLMGAAVATLCSMVLAQSWRQWLVHRTFGASPFQLRMLITLALGAAVGALCAGLPLPSPATTAQVIVNIAVRSSLALALFGGGALVLRLSPELLPALRELLQRLRGR